VVGGSLSGSGAVTVYAPGVLNATNFAPSIGGALSLSGTNATLSLLDGVIGSLALNGGLSLNNSNVLKFDIGSFSLDQIAVSGAFAQSGKAVININQLSAPNAGTYTLIGGASGISAANFVLGNSLPGYTLSLSSDATALYLNVALNAPATAWWHNRTGTAWNGGSSGSYNWDTDQSSGTVTATFPAPATDVYFAADAASSYSTTLGANFSIKSLTFNTANNVTVAGANTLTLGGPITVNSGAGANTISVGSLAMGLDQNVNVVDSGATLNISAPITGGYALKINDSFGSGTVALSGSSTYTGNTILTYGTLALKNVTNTLPDTSAVTINNGAVLSIGTNTDTVGAITLASGTIAGSSGVLTGSAYNMQNGTVAANLGGAAAMTVNGSMILASNSTYSGGTTISSGMVQVGASNALGSGTVTINNSTTLDLNGQTIGNVINFSSAGTLRNDAAADAAVTANANVYNNPIIDTTGGNITVARLVGNAVRTVLKTGDKTLTFNGAGHNNQIKLQVQGGTVICANNGGYTADRGFELDYGTVKLAGPGSGGAYPNANLFNDGQSFQILATPSTFDLNGWNETVGTVYGVSGAVIENSAAGTNSTLTVGADNLTSINSFSGSLQNGAGILSIAKTGSGVQIFNGTSTYSGNTTINNGQLQVTASGASPNSTFVVNTNGGLTFGTDTAFVLGGLAGAGDVSLLNDGFSPIALTVGGNNASTTYSGALLDGGTGATVVKVGTGTLTLAGTNNYSGLTTVSNGVLVVSPNYNAGFDFTVKSGAAFGPAGNPGANSALVGTVTAESGSALLFSSLPTPSTAPITVNTLAPSATVNISVTAVLTVGTYNLVNYTNLTGGGFGALALGTLPAGVGAYLNNNTAATPKVIQLVVTNVAPQVWSGAVNTNWDISATANWKISGSATNYHDFSATLFDDTVGSGQTLVNLATNVQPSSLTISNLTKDYTFTTASGSGISGATALVKQGSGTLTLVNVTNTFAGGATISAGSVVLSSATLGSGTITDNASLVFSNGTQLVTNIIGGSGTVAKNGSGTLELSGANTFNGLAIKNGTVQPDNTGALGTGTITLGDGASASSATLWFPNQAGNHTYTNPIAIAAGGTGTYNLQYVGFPDCHLSGGIALNNAATFTVTAGGALFVDSPIVSGAGSPTITVNGGNSTTKFVYLTADNSATLTSSFIVTNKGNLKSGHTNSLSAANAVALDSTSWLDTGAKSLTIAGLNDFGGTGGNVANSGGGTFLTLGGSGSYAFSGSIQSVGGVVKAGIGTQTLSGANAYTGPTIVSNGTLVISGSIDGGAVTVAGGTLAGTGLVKGATTVSGGTLAPGIGGIGTLTISNSLNLQGTLAVDISQAGATNDVITGLTSVTYGGTLAVNNLAGTLTTADSFKLFSAGSYNGAFAGITPTIPAAGLAWNTNTLTTDGVLRIAVAGPSGPGTITNSIVGSSLNLTWPSGQGWRLESQTNSIATGLSATGWGTVSGAADGSYSATIDPAKPTVFYRLVSP
jgi:autotransporter-associated beta strand protein